MSNSTLPSFILKLLRIIDIGLRDCNYLKNLKNILNICENDIGKRYSNKTFERKLRVIY